MTTSSPEEKRIYNPSGYLNTLNKVARSFTEETNKTMKIAVCIFLVMSTFVVYAQVQDHEFLNYDDNKYVTESYNVKSGLCRYIYLLKVKLNLILGLSSADASIILM